MTPDQIPIAGQVRVARLVLGLRQADLAAKLGVVPSVVCEIENGSRLPTERHLRIFDGLFRRARREIVQLVNEWPS